MAPFGFHYAPPLLASLPIYIPRLSIGIISIQQRRLLDRAGTTTLGMRDPRVSPMVSCLEIEHVLGVRFRQIEHARLTAHSPICAGGDDDWHYSGWLQVQQVSEKEATCEDGRSGPCPQGRPQFSQSTDRPKGPAS